MKYAEQLSAKVLNQMRSLPFWRNIKNRVAVAIVGSVGAGINDMHSDLDVYLFVPENDSMPLYEDYKKGYEAGTIGILNPRAFQFDEFPMVKLADGDGHHRAMVFESIEGKERRFRCSVFRESVT
jgi:hypothetical protein